MSLVLDLPQPLDSQIQREALKHGMSPQAYATHLLLLATRFVDETTGSLASTFSIDQKQATLKTSAPQDKKRQSAFGRYAHVASSSDSFALEKQREIDHEEGKSL